MASRRSQLLLGASSSKPLIHGGQRNLGSLRRRRAFRRCYGNLHLCFFASSVDLAIGRDLDLQFVRLPSHIEFGNPQFICGPPQVHRCRWLNPACPPAYHQHGNKNIGRVAAFHRDLDDRLLSGKLPDESFSDAFPLDGDERSGFAERHPYLELCLLAGLVAFLFRQKVDAVVIPRLEPPFILSAIHIDV